MIFLLLFLTLPDLQKFYEEGKYLKVIEKAQQLLKDTTLSKEDRVGLHLILGFCYSAMEDEGLAKLEFLEALTIKPTLKLDPMMVSPKIIKIFNKAKTMLQEIKKIDKRKEEKIEKTPPVKMGKILKKKMIDLVLPGTYYFRKGENFKAYLLLGGTGLSLMLGGVFSYWEKGAHQRYLEAREKQEIEEAYRTYSLYYKAKMISIGTGLGIYLLNLILLAKE